MHPLVEIEVEIEFAPRPEYGLVTPLIAVADGGIVARGGADILFLSCPVGLAVTDATATGRVLLKAGDRLTLGLTHRTR